MYFLNLNVTVFSVGVVYNIPHRVSVLEWTEEVEPFCSYLSLPTSFSELFLNQGELLERVVNQ